MTSRKQSWRISGASGSACGRSNAPCGALRDEDGRARGESGSQQPYTSAPKYTCRGGTRHEAGFPNENVNGPHMQSNKGPWWNTPLCGAKTQRGVAPGDDQREVGLLLALSVARRRFHRLANCRGSGTFAEWQPGSTGAFRLSSRPNGRGFGGKPRVPNCVEAAYEGVKADC